MSIPKLKKITIKPVYKCGAACIFCNPRQDLYTHIGKETILTLSEWMRVFSEASQMGVEEISISGGEPSLYPDLHHLVDGIKKQGMKCSINSNGLGIQKQATSLANAGVDEFCFSLYSRYAEIHNKIKGVKIWDRLISSIKHFKSNYPEITVGTYFILLNETAQEIVEYSQFCSNLSVDYIFFSYLQGEFSDQQLYVKLEAYLDFVRLVGDANIVTIHEAHLDEFRSLITSVEPENVSRGIYNQCKGAFCETPSSFCIILPNGDVHACNMVEHSHQGVVGNIKSNTLHEIFYGETYETFRSNGLILSADIVLSQ